MQSAVEAVNQTGTKAIATDWDQNALSERVLGSAIKCYNTAVQRQLYKFFSGGAAWGQEDAGQTERLGYTDGSVALAGSAWRFDRFSERDYERLYEQLRNSELEVGTYSDLDTLPETPPRASRSRTEAAVLLNFCNAFVSFFSLQKPCKSSILLGSVAGNRPAWISIE